MGTGPVYRYNVAGLTTPGEEIDIAVDTMVFRGKFCERRTETGAAAGQVPTSSAEDALAALQERAVRIEAAQFSAQNGAQEF